MATTDEILQQLLSSQQTYTPKTADQIRTQAQGEYQSLYDQRRRTAQQLQQSKDLSLQQQLSGIGRSYDKAREQSIRDYGMRYSQADRQMLSRGMQRSSYAAQVLANLDLEGQRALDDISEQQISAEGNIEAQRTQLAQQLAEQLAGYDADQAADVLARIRELEDQEYERSMQTASMNNSLSAQIYQFLYQAERDKIEDERWQMQWDKANKKSSGSSYTPKAKTPTEEPEVTDDSFWKKMGLDAGNKDTNSNAYVPIVAPTISGSAFITPTASSILSTKKSNVSNVATENKGLTKIK